MGAGEYHLFGRVGNMSVTVPARLAQALGLEPGGRVRWEIGPGRSLVLRPVPKGPDGEGAGR